MLTAAFASVLPPGRHLESQDVGEAERTASGCVRRSRRPKTGMSCLLTAVVLLSSGLAPAQNGTTQNQPTTPALPQPPASLGGTVVNFNSQQEFNYRECLQSASTADHIKPLTKPAPRGQPPAAPSAIEMQVCNAIGAIPCLQGQGEDLALAKDDLEKLKKDGKIQLCDRMPAFAATSPDGGWKPTPGEHPYGIWTGNAADNHICINEFDFDPESSMHKFGDKGLAVILVHEWAHARVSENPWDKKDSTGAWSEAKIRKCHAKRHVDMHMRDLARLDALINGGHDTPELKMLRDKTDKFISKYKRDLLQACKDLGE